MKNRKLTKDQKRYMRFWYSSPIKKVFRNICRFIKHLFVKTNLTIKTPDGKVIKYKDIVVKNIGTIANDNNTSSHAVTYGYNKVSHKCKI